MAILGNHAFLNVNSPGGLAVVSITDPANPTEVGHYYFTGNSGVAVDSNYVYVTDHRTGLWIYESYEAGIQEMSSAEIPTPNAGPTIVRGALRMGVDSRQNREYRAELLNVSGRKVLDLHHGTNDVSGLAPGIYFVRQPSRIAKVILTE